MHLFSFSLRHNNAAAKKWDLDPSSSTGLSCLLRRPSLALPENKSNAEHPAAMDPVTAISLAATVASTFREVYVVARFIYRTIDHVKKSESEQEDLQVEFMSEILYLDSFGRLYLTSGGIMGDAELDKVNRFPFSWRRLLAD